MATIRNPINQHKYIELLPAVLELESAYGFIHDSGLFKKNFVKTNMAMYRVIDDLSENKRMTKFTSRTERDAVALSKEKYKAVTVGGVSVKSTGGVHVEDLQNNLVGLFSEQDETFQEALLNETERLYERYTQGREFVCLTSSSGRTLNPLDGSVEIDMFVNTGTTQTTHTIDLSPTSTTVLQGLNELRNKVVQLNNGNGTVREIELPVSEAVFSALISAPELIGLYQLALAGRGREAIENNILTGTADRPEWTRYGYRRTMRIENFLIYTYPQDFYLQNGGTYVVGEGDKSWTIVRGVTNAYEINYAPAPYASCLGQVGQEIYARSTGIINDTHADITIESHFTPMLKRPELAIDVTFKLA